MIHLSNGEEDFIWCLVNQQYCSATRYFEPLYNQERLIKYCVDNRIDGELNLFLARNNSSKLQNVKHKKYLDRIRAIQDLRTSKILNAAFKLLSSFETEKINYVSLKGVHISTVNPNYRRSIRDIDLLVDNNDIEKAYKLAKQHGFKFKNSIVSLKILLLG